MCRLRVAFFHFFLSFLLGADFLPSCAAGKLFISLDPCDEADFICLAQAHHLQELIILELRLRNTNETDESA